MMINRDGIPRQMKRRPLFTAGHNNNDIPSARINEARAERKPLASGGGITRESHRNVNYATAPRRVLFFNK